MGRTLRYLIFPALCFLGAVAWAGESSNTIALDELRSLQLKGADFILWDARDQTSFELSHIQGATLPLDNAFYKATALFAKGLISEAPDPAQALKNATKALDKDRLIVTYCNRNCKASEMLGIQLRGLGFTKVKWMEAGLQTWEEKGYPVTIGVPKLRES